MTEAEKREAEERGRRVGKERGGSHHAYLSCSMSSRRVFGFSRKQSTSTDCGREGEWREERREEEHT